MFGRDFENISQPEKDVLLLNDRKENENIFAAKIIKN